jgi:hypothetical protein
MDYKKAYEEAKASGYSDSEIAQHLSGDEGKYREAIDNGYGDAEIISHFTGRMPAPAADASVQSTSPSTSNGLVEKLKSMTGQAVPMVQQAVPQITETADLLTNPLATMFRKAPDIAQRAANFVQDKPNVPAQTLMEAAGNRPDQTALTAMGMIPGVKPISMSTRVLGSAGAAALNPDNKGENALAAGGLQTVLEALPYGAGKLGPGVRAIMSKASGVDAKAIKQLFDNPALLWTGPNMQEARSLYKATAEKIGLAPEVSDDVLFGSGKKFVRNVTEALQHNEEVPTQSLLDARQATDDLIEAAKRRGKMNQVKGFQQRRDIINQQLAAQAPELRTADKTFSQAATRDQFMNAMPMNQNGTPSVGRLALGGLLGGAGFAAGGPGGIAGVAATSPYVQGVATSAAGAVKKTVPALKTGLQVLRQYIENQRLR